MHALLLLLPTLATTTLAGWSDSTEVEKLSFRDKEVQEMLKEMGPNAAPVALEKALKGLEPLLKFGKKKNLKVLLDDGRMEPTMPSGVKVNKKSPVFAVWDRSMVVRTPKGAIMDVESNGASGTMIPGVMSKWFDWSHEDAVSSKKFFKSWDKTTPSSPYMYWMSEMPLELSREGVVVDLKDTRPTLCEKVMHKGLMDACLLKGYKDRAAAVGEVVGTTIGTVLQGQLVRDYSVIVQLQGKEKWTFWRPQDLANVCIYPSSHPGHHTASADLGEGVGKPCSKMEGVHSRSITLQPGEILIVPPMWLHKVETVESALHFVMAVPSPHSDSHDGVANSMVGNLTRYVPVHHRVCVLVCMLCCHGELQLTRVHAA